MGGRAEQKIVDVVVVVRERRKGGDVGWVFVSRVTLPSEAQPQPQPRHQPQPRPQHNRTDRKMYLRIIYMVQ